MDLSLLLLTTPIIPPTPPVSGVPRPATGPLVTGAAGRPAPEPVVAGVVPRLVVAPMAPGPEDRPPAVVAPPLSRPPGPICCPPGRVCCPPGVGTPPWAGPEIPDVPCWPTGIGWKSSLVIGSLNFLRKNRCSTRTFKFGGNAFEDLREKRAIACTYCWPRNTSSSSFSRWAACRQTGMATDIMTAMMASATSRAAIAYPRSPRPRIVLFV